MERENRDGCRENTVMTLSLTHTLFSTLSQPFTLVELIYSHSFNSTICNSQLVSPIKTCFPCSRPSQPTLSGTLHVDDSQDLKPKRPQH